MIRWFCGRCRSFVDYEGWRVYSHKPCKCDGKYALPLWYVPTTIFQKLRCKLNMCRYKGTCNTCDNGPYDSV